MANASFLLPSQGRPLVRAPAVTCAAPMPKRATTTACVITGDHGMEPAACFYALPAAAPLPRVEVVRGVQWGA